MATKAFINTFTESGITTDFDSPSDFTDATARRMRYAIYWTMYENTAYRNIHKWAESYRNQYGLYKFIRNLFNPAYRLGEFWVSHTFGGQLDPLAGDGSGVPSAIPIATDDKRLRVAISRLWRDSNWQVNKDIFTLHGAILGDAIIRVNDDTEHGRVYMEVINPGDVTDVTVDNMGNVKHYRIDQTRKHPESGQDVLYTEIAENMGGGAIHYSTFLDGIAYPWNGQVDEWDEGYGFVPMVTVQHHNVGLDWGWSEIHPSRSKMHEADDLASLISDQIRKTVNPFWLFAGVEKPSTAPGMAGASATSARPQPGREELPALYAKDAAAKAQALVAPFDFPGMTGHLDKILGEIEGEYPELHYDKLRLSGDLSGAALRTARQPAEQKVRQRRAAYDDGLVRAQQMAVAIGGMRGYNGYEGFGLDSYDAGALDHAVGDRAVFGTDQLEQYEEDTAFWTAAQAATNAGYPLEAFLADHGWTPEKIRERLYTGLPEQ